MAFGGGFDEQGEVMSEINMTPLVDVMLVLLVIFILTVPVLTHSVKLNLPQASNQKEQIKPQAVTLSVLANGQLYWDETAVSEQELRQRLTAAAGQQPQPQLRIRGDKKVEYQHVAKLMTQVQQAGIHQLGFVTEPGK
jgi:biopolymer transport protein ExbD